MKTVFAQRENRVNNLMQRAESMTENLKNWWKTDFTPKKKYPEPQKNTNYSGSRRDSTRTSNIEEVVVTAMGIRTLCAL